MDWQLCVGDSTSRRQFLEELRYALCKVGFLVLTNAPGLESDLQSRAFQAAHHFFNQSLPTKQRYTVDNSPHFRGYLYRGEPDQPISIATEAYQIGQDRVAYPKPKDPLQIWRHIEHGPNIWPLESDAPDFRSSLEKLHHAYGILAHSLGDLICEVLGIEPDLYRRYFATEEASIELPDFIAAANYNRDPKELTRDERIRIEESLAKPRGGGAHIDGAPFITLLIADEPGLEVLSHDGEWVDVPVIPGSVVCNIGGTLMALSGKRMKATVHRVNPLKPHGPRVSLPFFPMPTLDGPLLPFDGSRRSFDRDRGLAYAYDRMQIFQKATQKFYPEEFRYVSEAVEKEDEARRAAVAAKL